MVRNNRVRICLALLFFVAPICSAEVSIDFDRKSLSEKELSDLLLENDFVFAQPYIAEESSTVLLREIMDDEGIWREFEPIDSWIDGDGIRKAQYAVLPNQIVRWTLRCPKGKWTAKLTYKLAADQIGGHYHYDIPLPDVFVSSPSLSPSTVTLHSAPSPINFSEMKGSTTYYFLQAFPDFATGIIQQFDSYGACQGISQTDHINVQVPGLVEMPYADNYVLDNPQDSMGGHPDNHYGTKKLIDTLTELSNQYALNFPAAEPLHINDMSLPWGGIFDVGYNWKSPHSGHTIGADADINRELIPLRNREKLLQMMCSLTPGVALEQEYAEDIPHFHLRVYGKGSPENGTFGMGDTRIVVCCRGNSVDPDNLPGCISDSLGSRE